MKTDDTSQLKILGSGKTSYQFDQPTADMLETFPNNFPERDYIIQFACPEFTSLCPMTGQPDFAEFVIDYVPDERCIESKSLKLYLFAFRNHGSFMETITNTILNDLVAACQPRSMTVTGTFLPRGGITMTVTATHTASK